MIDPASVPDTAVSEVFTALAGFPFETTPHLTQAMALVTFVPGREAFPNGQVAVALKLHVHERYRGNVRAIAEALAELAAKIQEETR